MSLCDGGRERGLEVDAERRGVGDAAVLRACDFRGGEGEGDGEVVAEHAEKADKEPVHVAAALATHLETGFDRIDLFCFLDGLGVFEILDENVLDVDGNGMEEIERVREGLSGVPDER